MLHIRRLALTGVIALFLLPTARAEVRLAKIFSDNMVLQRDSLAPIWGWDKAGAQVTVTMGTIKSTGTADASGKFQVNLPPTKAGGPHTLEIEGTSKVTLKNVLFGEVWLCSGQSNMEWSVASSTNAKEEISKGSRPTIRHIKIQKVPSDKPQAEAVTSGWQDCTPATVGNFTAVGYFYALALQKELDVPIGLIGSNWGGTRIEPWTTPDGFRHIPSLKNIADNLDKFPAKDASGKASSGSPLSLYNGMIAPLVPYGMRGAIWYQGESNNGEGMLYADKMNALIHGWRKLWNNADMPFYYVQLAPYDYAKGPDKTSKLAGIWEAQTAVLKTPGTGMAGTCDISDIKDIHPKNKQDVGKRLALWALAHTYGKKDIVYSGPIYKGMKTEGNKIVLEFNHTGSGLVSRNGRPLTNFEIAGSDKKFVPAKAAIEGNTIVVTATGVSQPAAVRFGWHEEAEPNLSNKDGLPAIPFRTDTWAD
ncbi:MAG: 9-O-acetylesterase [Gemmataceae bacterium]|nr:9-O-acetylesterase [Gemmataceae bacterium]